MRNNRSARAGVILYAGVFAALLLVFIVLYRTVGIYYGINDDMTMQSLASGAFTGTPDAHLVFISYSLGLVISGLYRLLPGFDWYGITMTGLLFICFYILVIRIFRLTEKRPVIRLTGILIVLTVLAGTLLLFQFTLVAGVLAATALFCLASAKGRIRISEYVLAWVLLLLAAMIRSKVFLMALPPAAVITAGKAFRSPKAAESPESLNGRTGRRHLLGLLLVTALGIALCFGNAAVQKAGYSDAEWQEFKKYNHARSLITDYYGWPPYEGHEAFWGSVRISRREYNCLKMYGLLPDFSAETMIRISEYAEGLNQRTTDIPERLSEMYSVFRGALSEKRCLYLKLLLAGTLIVLVVYGIRSGRTVRIKIAAGLLTEVLIFLYLLYNGRMPVRIIQIYDYQCILAAFGLLLTGGTGFGPGWRKGLGAAGAAVCAAILVFEAAGIYHETGNKRAVIALYEEEKAYLRSHDDMVFCAAPETLTSAKKFTVRSAQEKTLKLIGTGGWSALSPWMEHRYRELGLDRHTDILLEDGVYFICSKKSYADRLHSYYNFEKKTAGPYEIIDTPELSNGKKLFVCKWTPKEPQPD